MNSVFSKSQIPDHLRKYFKPAEYGLEPTPAAYVETLRGVFAEARRVLADDGTCWLNLGDSYVGAPKGSSSTTDGLQGRSNHLTTPAGSGGKNGGGLPTKSLIGIPWRVAFALQDDGWLLRNEIIWSKPNAMPESVRDRLSSRHEHLFMFGKSSRYHFDLDAIREPHAAPERKAGVRAFRARDLNHQRTATGSYTGPDDRGRNPGDVWEIATRPFPAAHFATFPIDLPLRCIKAGCKPGGTVLDMFSGSGTTGAAARQLGRKYLGIDLKAAYHDLAKQRFAQGVLDLPA